MPSPALTASPDINRETGQVVVTFVRRAAAPRLCAQGHHFRQLAHPRRSHPPRIPPVRSGLVRRPEDQVFARPRRAPGLLQGQGSQHRHPGGAGRPGPGRRHPDRGRASRPAPSRSVPAIPARPSCPSLAPSARTTCSVRATTSASTSSTARTGRQLQVSTVDPYFTVDGVSRSVDLFYRTTPPHQHAGRGVPVRHQGRRDPLRCAVLRNRHRLLRHRLRADRHHDVQGPAQQLSAVRQPVRPAQQFHPVHDRLAA